MNETEIRARVHDAMGEANYPTHLESRVEARLYQPAPEPHPRALGLAAAILAVLVVAGLVVPRLLTARPVSPASTQSPAPTSPSAIPLEDLAIAHLSNNAALVKPFSLQSSDGGRVVTLIGAYADAARTVLFFRTGPGLGFPLVTISDGLGQINASSSGSIGIPGDQVYVLDAGPATRSGAAHITAVIHGFNPISIAQSQITPGTWTFSFDLMVQPSTTLDLTPILSMVGSWKVTLEAFEATPAVIHFQAVIDGALPSNISDTTVELLDASGSPVAPIANSAGTAIPKDQPNPSNQKLTRVNDQWARPTATTLYQLRITGGGGTYQAAVTVPAPSPAPSGGKSGYVPQPTDYPASDENLTLRGAFNATITTGHPQSCGFASGPSGTLFAFATYFQVGGAWYYITFYTDPSVREYKGPGTYTARASFSPEGPRGPMDVVFTGMVQLTVTSDRKPDSGSVNGTLNAVAPQPGQLTVSGTWTCTPGAELGPA